MILTGGFFLARHMNSEIDELEKWTALQTFEILGIQSDFADEVDDRLVDAFSRLNSRALWLSEMEQRRLELQLESEDLSKNLESVTSQIDRLKLVSHPCHKGTTCAIACGMAYEGSEYTDCRKVCFAVSGEEVILWNIETELDDASFIEIPCEE